MDFMDFNFFWGTSWSNKEGTEGISRDLKDLPWLWDLRELNLNYNSPELGTLGFGDRPWDWGQTLGFGDRPWAWGQWHLQLEQGSQGIERNQSLSWARIHPWLCSSSLGQNVPGCHKMSQNVTPLRVAPPLGDKTRAGSFPWAQGFGICWVPPQEPGAAFPTPWSLPGEERWGQSCPLCPTQDIPHPPLLQPLPPSRHLGILSLFSKAPFCFYPMDLA